VGGKKNSGNEIGHAADTSDSASKTSVRAIRMGVNKERRLVRKNEARGICVQVQQGQEKEGDFLRKQRRGAGICALAHF